MLRAFPRLLARSATRSNLGCASWLTRRWCSGLVDRKLVHALETEIEHEAAIDDKKECPKLSNFEVAPDGMHIDLKRKMGKETVTVRFLVQVSTDEDSDVEDDAPSTPVAAITSNLAGLKNLFSSSDRPEAESVSDDAIANRYFSVVIDKGAQALLFDCAWQDSRLRINHVAFFADATAAHRVAALGDDANCTTYEGPEVSDLSDSLSALWYDYLMSRGVNETMGGFMTAYSKYKEQQEYVAWLAHTLKFVQD